MLNFTPPPRQQVLYGIRVQAEQARNLVEDLQAGSETASNDLLNLSSQILARARLYKWPRLTIWASALEERLTKATNANVITDEDLNWFSKHVERLDDVLNSPAGVDEGGAEGGRESPKPAASAAGSKPAPTPIFGDGEESIEIDYSLDFDDEAAEGGVQIVLDELEEEEQVQEPPEKRYTPTTPTPRPNVEELEADESEALDAAFDALTSEGLELEASEDSTAAAEVDEATPVPEATEAKDVQPEVAADAEPDQEQQDDPPPAAGGTEAVLDRSSDEEDSLSTTSEDSGELSGDSRATLGRLDIQRREKRRTNTEIQGPNQYIVVSVSTDHEDHLWLGRMLPERRFELLTARGAAEAEILCREHQPDLVLIAWEEGAELVQQTLDRIRENPLTRYVRVALIPKEESLACHLAATRVDAIGVIPQNAEQKEVASKVLLCVLASGELPTEELGETSMPELSDLLLRELRVELDWISEIVGDVAVPVGGLLGDVLRATSRKLRDGVKLALGCDQGTMGERPEIVGVEETAALFHGKRALVMEADRLRRAELARVLGELGLEVLPPMPDLTKALEAGLAWAPDVLICGAPHRDSRTCLKILKRDIALSSMSGVMISWPDSDRQWPDATADMATLRPVLVQQMAEAFAPLAEIQRRLQELEEVTGRVESCGILGLIQLVMGNRSQALLEVSEGTEQFKAMIADGKVLDAIWVEADGTMTAHFDAFARMLAVTRGRFFIRPLEGGLPNLNLPGSLTELLTAACHWWRPLGLVIDQQLFDIEPLELDKRRASELKRQTGKLFRKVVSALAKGATPGDLVDAGVSADVVAQVLRELVKRSVVKQLPVARSSTSG